MSNEITAPVAGDAISYALPADAPAEMTVSDAARMLSQARRARQEAPAAESASQATAAEPELASEANADPLQEAPGEVETQEAEPADESLPLIEPPRSWTKDEKEAFKSWPREAQESVSRVASTREAEFRRSQNEVADAKKATSAQMAQAHELTKSLAEKLPQIETAVREYMGRQYPEFKSYDDVVNMARQAEALSQTDPFTALQLSNRVAAWQADQNKVAMQMQDARSAAQRLEQERGQTLLAYRQEESKKLEEFFPETKDPDKLKVLTGKAVDHLKGFDLSDEQLNAFAAQGDKPFIFSAAFQRILLNSLKYEEIQKAPAKVVPKSVLPVSRPGTARGGNPSGALQIQNLETQLSKATGTQALRIAAQLTNLKRTAAAR